MSYTCDWPVHTPGCLIDFCDHAKTSAQQRPCHSPNLGCDSIREIVSAVVRLQMAMSSLAFLLSTFVSKASTAVNVGFAIFVIGWIVQVCPCPDSRVFAIAIATMPCEMCGLIVGVRPMWPQEKDIKIKILHPATVTAARTGYADASAQGFAPVRPPDELSVPPCSKMIQRLLPKVACPNALLGLCLTISPQLSPQFILQVA